MPITAVDPDGKRWTWGFEPDDEFPQYATNHYALDDRNQRHYLSWSRFERYEARHFRKFIAAGFPSKAGNWFAADIDAINVRKEAA